jgi:Xaa-Pro aminopeptidase
MSYPRSSVRAAQVLSTTTDDQRPEDGATIVNDTRANTDAALDVTRSYRLAASPDQRKIYDIVLAVRRRASRGGRASPSTGAHATVRVIVDGLLALGILSGDREEIVKTRAYQKFYPHGSSHWVGLNVHDAGSYSYPPGVSRLERYGKAETKLAPGMVLTVEPGIYFPEKSTADPRWWNIGVRVEDVVAVTAGGMECLSCSAPREAADVEKAIADGRAKRAAAGRR